MNLVSFILAITFLTYINYIDIYLFHWQLEDFFFKSGHVLLYILFTQK